MTAAEWYFDFISPFSYLQHAVLGRLPDDLEITYTPVVFAGLLKQWGQKGPAEIPAKRLQTNRQCQWWADRNDIPFKVPPGHPFNPLGALRLSIALGNTAEVVRGIFEFIWVEGRAVDDETSLSELATRLGRPEAAACVADPEIKAALIANGERAIAAGVYGVPTFVVKGELFWGVDTTDMLLDYLKDPKMFSRGEMARFDDLPMSAQRPGSK